MYKEEKMLAQNNEWEILTDNDEWVDFKGITKTTKLLRCVSFENNDVWASDDHIFFVNNKQIKLSELDDSGYVDGIHNTKIYYEKTNITEYRAAYDVCEVDNSNHKYVIENNILTHNCDEFGHVDPNVAELFWTAIAPTLATGGKALIASTPNGDNNLYATLWRGAQSGSNGFKPVEIKWDEPPGRDEAFKQEQIGKIGILKWEQEYQCLQSETMLNIIDELGNERNITIKQLYVELAENEYT